MSMTVIEALAVESFFRKRFQNQDTVTQYEMDLARMARDLIADTARVAILRESRIDEMIAQYKAS